MHEHPGHLQPNPDMNVLPNFLPTPCTDAVMLYVKVSADTCQLLEACALACDPCKSREGP